MKKILCLFISTLLVLCPLFISGASAETNPSITVTVASDLHFYSRNRVGDMRENEKYDALDPYYNATTQGQMSDISESIIREFLDEFVESDSEILLLPGDLTQGFISDHYELAALFQDTCDRARSLSKTKRIFVINGNHDITSSNPEKITSAEEFRTIYKNFGYSDAFSIDEQSCSYAVNLDDNYILMAIDSCEYGEDDGKIDDSRMQWIKLVAEKAEAEGKELIVMLHHSVVPHFSLQPMSDGYENWINTFAGLGIKYVLTGHIHANDISCAEADNGETVYDIMTGSLITSPDAYRTVTYSDESVSVSTGYITSVKEEYLPEGISDSMKNLIVSDFPSYAKNFFTEGMSRWIYKYIGTPYKLAQLLDIEEGSVSYNCLASVMSYLGDALHLPLYDSEDSCEKYDSFEEICSAYGYTLPESDYKVPGDVVAAVMEAFYAGDENITADSEEIKILYSVLSAGIVYAAASLNANGNSAIVNGFFDAVGIKTNILTATKAGSVFAGRKAADIIAGSILSPLVTGVSSDEYSPSDLNTVLPGFSSASGETNPAPVKLISRITVFIKKFFESFRKYMQKLFITGC